MNFRSIFIVVSFVFFAFSASSQTVFDVAEDFTVKDTEGQQQNLFSILDNDKIVVISFSTTS